MVEELEDRWILGLRGSSLVAISHAQDYPEIVATTLDGAVLTIRGPVHLAYGPATAPSAVELPARELDGLVGATVVSAIAFKSGSLRIVFNTGHHLSVRGYEPEVEVRIQSPGDFDWQYRKGVGIMKNLGSDPR